MCQRDDIAMPASDGLASRESTEDFAAAAAAAVG